MKVTLEGRDGELAERLGDLHSLLDQLAEREGGDCLCKARHAHEAKEAPDKPFELPAMEGAFLRALPTVERLRTEMMARIAKVIG